MTMMATGGRVLPALPLTALSVRSDSRGPSACRRVHPPLRVNDHGEIIDDDHVDAEIDGHVVRLLRRDTRVVERSFRFADRVLDAVLTHFGPDGDSDADDAGDDTRHHPGESRSDRRRHRRRRRDRHQEPSVIVEQTRTGHERGYRLPRRLHLCVLARADCVHIYAPDGDEVFEVALPFHADRVLAGRRGGLVLQRRSVISSTPSAAVTTAIFSPPAASASTLRMPETPPQPRFFTLQHPLDEVKPLALSTDPLSHFGSRPTRDAPRFLSDPALQMVNVCGPLTGASTEWLVCFHTTDRRFLVYALTAFTPDVLERQVPRSAPKTSFVSSQSPSLLLLSPTEHRRQERERAKNQTATQSVHLEPDKAARLVWTSPCIDAVARTATNPAATTRAASTTAREGSPAPSFSAFVASDHGLSHSDDGMDDEQENHLLCLLDAATGVLVLKTMGERSQSWTAVDPVREIRALRCRSAVPVILSSGLRQRCIERVDVVVEAADGQLVLLCGGVQAATLVGPRPATTPRSNTVRLEPAATGTLWIAEPQGVMWRCQHPLYVSACSSAVALIWDALACSLPSATYIQLRLATLLSAAHRHSSLPISDRWMAAFASVVIRAITTSLSSPQSSSTNDSRPRDVKKPRNSIQTTQDLHPALAAMNSSSFARLYQHEHAMVLAPLEAVFDSQEPETANATVAPRTASAHVPRLSVATLQALVTALHLTHEELRLSLAHRTSVKELGALLVHLSTILHLRRLRAYYHRQQLVLHWEVEPSQCVNNDVALEVSRLDDELSRLDILQTLQSLLRSDITPSEEECDDEDTMMLSSSSWSVPSSDVWDDCALFSKRRFNHRSPFWRVIALRQIFKVLFARRSAVVERDWALDLLELLTLDPLGAALDFSDLPVGVRLPLLDAIRVIRESPPPGITPVMSRLVGRFDLDSDLSTDAALSRRPDGLRELRPMDGTATNDDGSRRPATDGLTEMISSCQRLFPHDQRLKEVARLLRSSRPLCLKLEKTADMSDQDFVAQQQARLLLLCKRSMALSVARGMVTLGTLDASSVDTHAWHLSIPALPLAGRTPPTNAVVALDVSGYAKELTHWPQFHNGCATALRLPTRDAAMGLVTRYWIKYHRPSARDFAPSGTSTSTNAGANSSGTTSARPHSLHQSARDLEEAQASHAGLLLGLGLKGHLRCLSMADVYNYLSLSNEFITVAILLGMAATAAHSRRRRRQRIIAQVLRRRRPTSTFSTGSQGNSQSSMHGNDDDDDAMIAPSQDDPLGATDDLEIESSQPAPTQPQPSTEEKPTNSAGAALELSLERSVSKMLCLHIPSLLPAPFAEFSVPASTQTAALLGLGILYQGTGHRLMTELLLAEITRAPSTVQYGAPHSGAAGVSPVATPFDQLEGYSLAAGLALGLVVLGRGRSTGGDPGLADLALEDRLSKLIVGGAQAPNPTQGGTGAGSCLYRGRQWKPLGSGRPSSLNANGRQTGDEAKLHGSVPSEQVNVAVTAGGSALALAFMYLKSGNRSIASLLAVPDTMRLLDYVRPDLLLLRTLAKNLVMWDSIEPSIAWVETKEIPLQLRETYRMIRGAMSSLPDDVDIRAVCEAHANITAGACFGIGLRFAGTGNGDARDTARHFVRHFRDMRAASSLLGGDVVAAATERATIERCLAVCAQALALVDAGTGDVDTLTLLRSINLRQRAEAELTYGNHMALSMAIGLLFLGGGRATVSRSSDAIAMLVVALYPMAAMNTADNKYHLQAFRHLYALAVDSSRLVETVDTSTRENCSVTIKFAIRREHHDHTDVSPLWETLQTPCLLPDLATIDRIVIEDPAFYPVEILLDGSAGEQSRHIANIGRIRTLLEKNKILLQRRPHARGSPDELPGGQEPHDITTRYQDSSSNLNITIGQYLDVDAARIARSTEASVAWWAERYRQLRAMTLAIDDVRGVQCASHISTFYQLYRLQHPVFPFDSSSQLRQLQLISDYYRVDPFRLWSTASQRDVAQWLRDQVEESLRDLWRHADPATMRFTSSNATEVALVTGDSSPKWWATSTEAFLLAAVMQHFDAPPDVWNDPESWRRRMMAALAIAKRENAVFGFDAFAGTSTREQRTMRSLVDPSLSASEQAFWLRLVSFFLFST